MLRRKDSLVSALLPVLPLAFCHGCGGGSAETGPTGEAPSVSAPVTANQAPTLVARLDETVRVGENYDWQPTANDADGDKLTFSAGNLPPWASIDSNTGRITGTPSEHDIGVYESITISVADSARHITTSQPLSITVVGDAGTGFASLHWELPSSKVDGSPLDDLAGYHILYGRNSDDLDKSVFISGASINSYVFDSLAQGIWYFAVVGVSAGGLEGPPTTIASKSI
jgi:hypothetical protein